MMLRHVGQYPCESLECSVGGLADRLRDRMRPRGRMTGQRGAMVGRVGSMACVGSRARQGEAEHGKAWEGMLRHGTAWHGMVWRGNGHGYGHGSSTTYNLTGPDDPAWRSRNTGDGQRGRARERIRVCLCVRAHVVRSATDVERLGK